ncbi:MAG: Rieske (2Fe-2S) protein [Planctomycetes bacterium]|nr:Rieske (2Fe-2S) protein [Planctomycetota bacterium]
MSQANSAGHPAVPAGNLADAERRTITTSGATMLAGMAAGYGMFAWMAARFLYPAKATQRSWVFVAPVGAMKPGSSLRFRTPAGATVNVTRQGGGETVADFLALSSTCPHLGCQVHWQPENDRFFCPCHNGVFDKGGRGIGGPPGDAGQSLAPYPLKIENGLLYIEVPTEALADAGAIIDEPIGPTGPGHDPCLQPPELRTNPTGRPA